MGAYEIACKPLTGTVENSDDCDDSNYRINPNIKFVMKLTTTAINSLMTKMTTSTMPIHFMQMEMETALVISMKPFVLVLYPLDMSKNSLNCNDANPSITLPLWYLDSDGDGDGDINNTFENCEPPQNYVSSSNDCDDSNPEVSSTATEVCNGIDDDCDEQIDIDDPSWDSSSEYVVYLDGDGDGRGNVSSEIAVCYIPEKLCV